MPPTAPAAVEGSCGAHWQDHGLLGVLLALRLLLDASLAGLGEHLSTALYFVHRVVRLLGGVVWLLLLLLRLVYALRLLA